MYFPLRDGEMGHYWFDLYCKEERKDYLAKNTTEVGFGARFHYIKARSDISIVSMTLATHLHILS